MIYKTLSAVAALLFGLLLSVSADWDPGDGHKMHYPQLPDPNGWDVKIDEGNIVADDFLCTESGPISQVHFWGSWRGDQFGQLSNIHLSIHEDIPDPDGPGPAYSQPGNLLWEYNTFDHDPALVTSRPAGSGDQGWYDPLTSTVVRPDHTEYFQYNINIENPFVQEQGTIYWLDIHVINETPGTEFGWKTTLDHWNDDAVVDDTIGGYIELVDPLEPQTSLDMAFVVVPEPGSFVMLLFAGILLTLKRQLRM